MPTVHAPPSPPCAQVVDGNPCIEYIKYIIFPWFHKFEVVRDEKNGGTKEYPSVEEMVADYTSGALHPCECLRALVSCFGRGRGLEGTRRGKRESRDDQTEVESVCVPLPLAADLKPALAKHLNLILQPVRDHFENNAEAKELLKKVKSYKVTK